MRNFDRRSKHCIRKEYCWIIDSNQLDLSAHVIIAPSILKAIQIPVVNKTAKSSEVIWIRCFYYVNSFPCCERVNNYKNRPSNIGKTIECKPDLTASAWTVIVEQQAVYKLMCNWWQIAYWILFSVVVLDHKMFEPRLQSIAIQRQCK
jgi:hypothetical protein